MDILFALMLWVGGFATGVVGGYCLKGLFDVESLEGVKRHEYVQHPHSG